MLPLRDAPRPPRRTTPRHLAAMAALAAVGCGLAAVACGSSSPDNPGPLSSPGVGVDGSTGNGNGDDDDSGGGGGIFHGGEGGSVDAGTYSDVPILPEDFVPTDFGGYALGAPLQGDGS